MKFIALFIAIIPAFLLAHFIIVNAVNVPFWDDWDVPGIILIKLSQNSPLTFQDLIAQHNDSRKFFTKLIFIGLAYLTNWDVRYPMLVSFLLACLISFNIFKLSQLTLSKTDILLLFLILLTNLLIFSPVSENWLWSIQLVVFIPIACITSCLVVLYSSLKNNIKFVICAILATISTYSYANGMLAWIIIFPLLIFLPDLSLKSWKSKKILLMGWLACFTANISLYFYNFHKPDITSSPLKVIQQPINVIIKYFLTFLGAPLGKGDLTNSFVIGLILVIFIILICFYLLINLSNKKLLYQAIPWLAIASYSILNALLTTGRLGFGGSEQALASRYLNFSPFLAIALIYLIPLILRDLKTKGFGRSQKWLFFLITVFLSSSLIFLSLTNFVYGIERMSSLKEDRLYGKSCLLLINVFLDSDCIKSKIYPHDIDMTQARANQFNDIGFITPKLVDHSIFDTPNKTGMPIERQFGKITLKNTQPEYLTKVNLDNNFVVSGWAINPKAQKPADAVILTAEQSNSRVTPLAIAQVKEESRDLSQALQQKKYDHSGWQYTLSADTIPADATQITAWSFDSENGKAYKIGSTTLKGIMRQKFISEKNLLSGVEPKFTIKNLGKISFAQNVGVIDVINSSTNSEQTIVKNTPIKIAGWAMLPTQNKPADTVIITVGDDNIITAYASVNLERPDVAQAFNNPALLRSGWNAEIELSALTGDKVILKAWIYEPTKKSVYKLYNTFTLNIQ
ncbi:hypothetical protein [Aphanothece hegewaldii]|uniref:hypothetical protein n=1 Tax=Aphanothece hegewaldii TaxID=1521625 RepID=UPI0011B20339|nr:hypothetical protein [Aphanothece hegewaldii]